MQTLTIALAAMTVGTLLGYLLCRAAAGHLLKTGRHQIIKKKMGVMDKVLIMEAVILVAYTVANLAVFWHTGAEPATLTACVFGVCGLENGVMGWIKTSKDAKSATKKPEQDPMVERAEPPDVGQ